MAGHPHLGIWMAVQFSQNQGFHRPARGRKGGRPKKLDEEQRELVTLLYKEGTPVPEILKTVKISKGTLYSYVREASPS